MNDLEKVAPRKCSQCHKFKTREQLTTAADDGGTAVHLCDDCKTQNAEKAIKAAKVLDTFRVTACTADGQVDDTTVAKALGMDAQARVAKNRRDDRRRAVETIDAALAKATDIGGELAKSQALDRLASRTRLPSSAAWSRRSSVKAARSRLRSVWPGSLRLS